MKIENVNEKDVDAIVVSLLSATYLKCKYPCVKIIPSRRGDLSVDNWTTVLRLHAHHVCRLCIYNVLNAQTPLARALAPNVLVLLPICTYQKVYS